MVKYIKTLLVFKTRTHYFRVIIQVSKKDSSGSGFKKHTLMSSRFYLDTRKALKLCYPVDLGRHRSKEYRDKFLHQFDERDGQQNSTSSLSYPSPLTSMSCATSQAIQSQLSQTDTLPGYLAVAAQSIADKAALDGDLQFVSLVAISVLEQIRSSYCSLSTVALTQVKYLSYEDLRARISNLDRDMEREIDDLRMRLDAKLQPIQESIDRRRKKQLKF